MNEPVKAMIDKLHARLDDLSEVVSTIPFELNGYDKRLDRIDDQVYLLEVELEKKAQGAVPLKPISAEQSDAFDAATGSPSSGKGASGAGAANKGTTSAEATSAVHIATEGATSSESTSTVRNAAEDAASTVRNPAEDGTNTEATSTVRIIDEDAADEPSRVKIAPTAEGQSEKGTEKGAVESSTDEKKSEGFLTDSAKETIAGATKTLNSLYKDGKEVVGEFSEAFGDIKEVLGKNPFKKRR